MLFAGLFVNDSTIFSALNWLQWLSPMRYGFNAGLISEFKPRDREYLYQEFLGFGEKMNFLYCMLCLLLLTIIGRVGSLIILKMNVKKF